MKKTIAIISILLICFSLNVKAIEKEELIQEIDNYIENTEDLSDDSINWINNNYLDIEIEKSDFEIIKNMANNLKEDNIEDFFIEFEKLLNNEQKLSFNEIKPNIINIYNDMDILIDDIITYLDNNVDSGLREKNDLLIKLYKLLDTILNKMDNINISLSKYKLSSSYKLKDINLPKYVEKLLTENELLINIKSFLKLQVNKINRLDDTLKKYQINLLNTYIDDLISEKLRNIYSDNNETFLNNIEALSERYSRDIENYIDNINEISLKDNYVSARINDLKKIKDKLKNSNDFERFTISNGYINNIKNDIITSINDTINYLYTLIQEVELISNNEKIIVKEDNKVIANSKRITENDFDNEISLDNSYNGLIGTGTIIKIMKNNQVINEYLVILKGDVKADGNVNIGDAVLTFNGYLKTSKLSSIQEEAGDFDGDGIIKLGDVVLVMNKSLER